MRLTNPADRSRSDNEAELEYLQHLHHCGVQVAIPLPSQTGAVVEQVTLANTLLLASVFTFAPGDYVDQTSPYWNEPFFREWGRALGRIHQASRSFSPKDQARRWRWSEEGLIAQAHHYIPPDDERSWREFETLMTWFQHLPAPADTFGLIHADFGPRNFHYHPETGLTAFDFGNCCYHWFIADLAISLSTLRHHPDLLAHLSWFIRLRILYVYLDRLAYFGPTPTAPQQQILQQLQQKVHEQFQWE